MHVKKGDQVKVIAGKEKGKVGRLLEIDRERMRGRVEGLMMVKRHIGRGKMQSVPDGGIIEKSASIHISNLMVVDPKTGEPTRVGRKKNEKGKNVRYSKKSGELLD